MKSRERRVRVIGGRWRGRRVRFPEAEGLRPTPDRVRETLFNWLAPYMAGARVLDLFAGSGILGFEALSREAAGATLVENNPLVAAGLRDTARELNAVGFEVVVVDAMAFLNAGGRGPYDIVFIDPPYAFAGHGAVCSALDASGLMAPNAIVYVEFPARPAPRFEAPDAWECHRAARAGHVAYQLWRRKPEAMDKLEGDSALPD